MKYITINYSLDTLTDLQLLHALQKRKETQQYSHTTQKQLIAALRLYYKQMHDREVNFETVYPTIKNKNLPVIINQPEVKRILEATTNLKHKTLLTVVYALGLRSGEVINLKISDIDKHRKVIHIRNAKGSKDRIIPYPDSIKPLLKEYYTVYKPQVYLFNGQSSLQYSAQSLRTVFKKSCRKAKINKPLTLHSLRHAYATHLMDQGTDVRVIKELLGHNSIKTTLIYTHVTTRSIQQVPSPLDFL